MARRATYFFDVRKTVSPLLLVSGPWEYMHPDGYIPPDADLKTLATAFGRLGYDVGMLSGKEAKVLKDNGASPGIAKTSEEEPYTILSIADGHKVGFLRFPSLPDGEAMPSAALLQRLSKSIAALKSQVDLLIALCDWGWVAENGYLKGNPQEVPDFLFGSGNGAGINGRILADDRCVWVRPYDQGRSVSVVSLFTWPERKNSFAWTEGNNYKTSSTGMNDAIMDNPEIGALFP